MSTSAGLVQYSVVAASRQKWVLVVLLSSGLALDYLARLGLHSVFPLLRKEIIATDVALGLVASSFPWTYGALSPIAGYLGDRFQRRRVVIASVTAWSVATALSGAVATVWQLVAMRVALAARIAQQESIANDKEQYRNHEKHHGGQSYEESAYYGCLWSPRSSPDTNLVGTRLSG